MEPAGSQQKDTHHQPEDESALPQWQEAESARHKLSILRTVSHALPYASVAVLGPGLLGGSVAMAVRRHMPACDLRLWARRQEPLTQAEKLGIATHTCLDVQEAVSGAELVILATPIGAFEELTQRMLPALSPHVTVTDVGSVKGYVHRSIGRTLTEHGFRFIGSHPMAGGEKQGLEHARAELMQGAVVPLTNAHDVPQSELHRLASFWQQLGCHTCEMSPELHDETVARVSHMPHILAALCARNALTGAAKLEDLQQLAASGFRDTTRVSSGGASMWADILWSNHSAIQAAISDCMTDLQRINDLLKAQNKAALNEWLETAKTARESIRRDA